MNIGRPEGLDYHRAADFIEAVRQLAIQHGYALGRGRIQHVDEPNGLPLLRFEVAQIGPVPGTPSPDSPTIRDQIFKDLGGVPMPCTVDGVDERDG